MVRAFVALELTEEIRTRLQEVQEKLRSCPGRLKLVEPSQIHITVKFLGEVAEKDLPAIREALGNIRFERFPVTVGHVAVNNPKRPFTIWCTISDRGKGADLFRLIEDALEPLGIARETRPFTPHATLARVKVPDPGLLPVIRSLAGETYGECTITGLKLKKSTLLPSGPVYEDLLEVPF